MSVEYDKDVELKGIEKEEEIIETFTYMNEECGATMIVGEIQNVLDCLEGDLMEMDCNCVNVLNIKITKRKMSKEEFDNLPEFMGC